jgi:hypothetical protein
MEDGRWANHSLYGGQKVENGVGTVHKLFT